MNTYKIDKNVKIEWKTVNTFKNIGNNKNLCL